MDEIARMLGITAAWIVPVIILGAIFMPRHLRILGSLSVQEQRTGTGSDRSRLGAELPACDPAFGPDLTDSGTQEHRSSLGQHE